MRQAIRKLPADQRPELRWYTIRSLRPDVREIDVGFVLHGDAGPGSRWAGAARPGDEVGFRAGKATYVPPDGDGRRLLAADETALPALAAILEAHGAGPAPIEAFAEVPDESYRQPLDAAVTWLFRGDDVPGSRLAAAVRDTDVSGVDYA